MSGNQALYSRSIATNPPASISEAGNRYLFAAGLPSLTVTAPLTDNKTYGDVYTFGVPVLGTDYTLTGFVDASLFGGVFTQDTGANIGLTGSPVLSSTGAPANASAAGSPYTINIAAGSLANTAGYSFGPFNAGGALTVNGAVLTVTSLNDSKNQDGVPYVGGPGVLFNGFVLGDDVSVLSGALTWGGSSQGAILKGSYSLTPGGFTSANYTINFVDGTLTIGQASVQSFLNNREALGELVKRFGDKGYSLFRSLLTEQQYNEWSGSAQDEEEDLEGWLVLIRGLLMGNLD